MNRWKITLVVVIVLSLVFYCEASVFKDIRYNGGTIQTNVDPKDWDNTLTVTSNEITLQLKDGQVARIDPSLVSQLSYGQEAHRRVGTMVALGIIITPLALFGLFHKTRLHFIGMEYKTSDGKNGGLLIQAHKSNYRAVLMSLRAATRAPISVSEEDRKYIASETGMSLGSDNQTVADDKSIQYQSTSKQNLPLQSEAVGTEKGISSKAKEIKINTDPPGASVFVNEAFAGMTPAKLSLAPGKYNIRLFLFGYDEWKDQLLLTETSESDLNITLKKSDQ